MSATLPENRLADTEEGPKALHLAWEVGVMTYGPDGPSFTARRIVRPPAEKEEVGSW